MIRARVPALCRVVLFVAACAAIPGASTTAVPRQEIQQPTFRSGASAIAVDESVRDSRGRPITNLTAADFRVFDNGVLQRIEAVSYGTLPIDVAVALDVSHSVTGALLKRLRAGVVQLMRDLRREDRLKLVLFNMRITRTVDYTIDVTPVEQAIRDAAAGGGTALFDTLSVMMVSAAAPERRQLIVAFTDGSDSASTTPPAQLVEIARRTRATLAFVMPRRARSGSPDDFFATLARETGGSVLPVDGASDLSAAFRRVLNEFRSAYVLHYTARGVDAGGHHTLAVEVNRKDAEVQARRGYFGS